MFKYCFTVVFSVFTMGCFAQFTYKSEIPEVTESGYYHILISPDVLASSKYDLSDVRIKDPSGKEVPYLLRTENPREQEVSFEYFNILSNGFLAKDSVTQVIVENEKKDEINQLCMVVQLADIQKYISLRGSDDGKNWYVVKQKSVAPLGIANDDVSEILVVDFPTGNYKYYEILVSNLQHDPVRVLNVAKYKYSEILGKYTEIPLGKFTQKDSLKTTILRFPGIQKEYRINKICFEIENKTGYYRTAFIERGEQEDYGWRTTNKSFDLSSQSENRIELGDFQLNKDATISIDNQDNPPLKITDIRAFQLNRYLTAYLERGITYSLFCGDEKLDKPNYDMVHFEEKIPRNLPLLELRQAEKLPEDIKIKTPVKSDSFIETPAFLWSVIIIVGLLLLWMCFRMIKETEKKTKK